MLPKRGKTLHRGRRRHAGPHGEQDFKRSIASALHGELGSTHRAVKTVMRWTGASERTVKHWFAGTHGPSAHHLIVLASHSDLVLTYFLSAARRPSLLIGTELLGVREKLLDLIAMIDEYDQI